MSFLFLNMRAIFRALVFFIAVCLYFLTALPFYPYLKIKPMKARKIICFILGRYARFTLWFMGIKVNRNIMEKAIERNYLNVSNHLSYTDILVICAFYPSCFVTSTEMRDTPFLGLICKLAGCVFVERRNKDNIGLEIEEITNTLASGLSVVIFPEATSTNGEEVIRFRRPLFKAALDSNVAIKPFTINYRYLDGDMVSLKNRDCIFWYGDMTFLNHLWGIFKIEKINVELTVGQAINCKNKVDYSALAEQSHRLVSSYYRPIVV